MNLCVLTLVTGVLLALCLASSAGQDAHYLAESAAEDLTIDPDPPSIIGIRVESYDAIQGFKNGTVGIYAGVEAPIRFFGYNLNNLTRIKFTTKESARGSECDELEQTEVFTFFDFGAIYEKNISETGVAMVKLREADKEDEVWHLCIRNDHGRKYKYKYIHQGSTHQLLIDAMYHAPLWQLVCAVFILQALSGLFSGLNLGLLSLDPRELQILASVGSAREREYATNIIPLRTRGNFLMCALIICNAAVNAGLTKILDDLLNSQWYAVAVSTAGVTMFGEIIPQTICARHGLAIGSGTRYLTYLVMGATGIISYPLSRALDSLLGGRDVKTLYDRERLMELIKVTKEENLLDNNELNIITGTLALKRRTVLDIMTKLADAFMLPYDAVLDFETLAEISRQGFTRIPIFDKVRTNIVGLLNIKDLALLDPDDCTAVKTLCMYYNYELCFVKDNTSLDLMLEEFKKGRSHMAFVRRFTGEAEGGRDPAYGVIGVVTLEDIIEEMIQAEISDESDLAEQDHHKPWMKALSIFTSRPLYATLITPQLQHAAFQFLSTSLEPFRDELMSQNILKRLIHHHDVARMIRKKPGEHEPLYLYKAGQPVDYFVLILEGRVQVTLGSEGLVFDSGPFTHFGTSALTLSPEERITYTTLPVPSPPSNRRTSSATSKTGYTYIPSGYFVPDFTVAVSSDVLVIQIRREHYLAGLRATALERSKAAADSRPTLTTTDDIFQREMEQAAKYNVSKSSQAQERTSGMIFHRQAQHGVHKKDAPPVHQEIPTSHPNITYKRMHPVTVEAKLAARKMELISNEAGKSPTVTEKLAIPPNKGVVSPKVFDPSKSSK